MLLSYIIRSYVLTSSFSIFAIYFFINENDYRHGIDYNIITIHLICSVTTYILYILLTSLYIIRVITDNNWMITYIAAVNNISLYNACCLICTGLLWGWSQWGTIHWFDTKILLTTILIILFLSSNWVININEKLISYIIIYNIYIIYHIPILKYNVIWNSEIHQKSTFSLLELFTINYNSVVISYITIVLLSVLYIYIAKVQVYKKLNTISMYMNI